MVMRQFLKKNGPAVSSSDVDKQLAALQTAQVAVGKSLGDYYHDTQQTEEQVRTNIHQAVQLDRYVQARTTPAELDKYFQANKEFFDKVTVRCRHIVLRVPSAASPAEREAIRQQLLGLRQQITAGQLDFAEAARKYSACPSAAGGGDIGYLVRKWMPVDEAILKTAFALKVGEVSEPVQSEVGLHLLQVTERSPGTPVTLDQCLPAVRESYQAELKQAVLVEQRQLAKVEIRLP
jgi:peptidyl-prolyl cis-trans isomerase C